MDRRIVEAVEETRRIIPDEKLEGFDYFLFRLRVYADLATLDPGLPGRLGSARRIYRYKIGSLDLYVWLRLLGLRYLAYLFEFPKGEPWDDVSRGIERYTYVGYYSYAFNSYVLSLPEVRREVGRLKEWLEGNPYDSGEFLRLAWLKEVVWARYNNLNNGTPMELLLFGEHPDYPPVPREQLVPGRDLEELARADHEVLTALADLLRNLASMLEEDVQPPIVELQRD